VYARNPGIAAQERQQKDRQKKQAPVYIGCYQDNGARDFKYGPKSNGYTVQSCKAACPKYQYFALQAGSQCFCDNSFSTPASQYPKRKGQCGSNHHGGAWRNAVYARNPGIAAQERQQKDRQKKRNGGPARGPTRGRAARRGASAPKPPRAPYFIGCYKDTGTRDLKYGPKRFGYSVKSCHTACPQYKFFALQAGSQCFCDNSYSTPSREFPKVPKKECGRSEHGGGWRNAVYGTGGAAPPPPPRTTDRRRRWF